MYSTLYSVCTLSQKHKNTEYSDEIMHRMGGVLIMQLKQGVSIKLGRLTKKPQQFDAIKKLYPGSLYYETD